MATLNVTLSPGANTGGTVTLPAVTGQSHYIVSIQLVRTASAALTGTAILAITTTNLGGIAFEVGNAMVAGGTQNDVVLTPSQPIQSAAPGVATTIVLPAPGAAVQWRANVIYYTDVPK